MGFFDKIKNAISNVSVMKLQKKIDPKGATSYGNSSSSSYTPKTDAAHEEKVEAMRKENELRALETERKMQDAGAAFAERIMNASAGTMEEANKMLEQQNKKGDKSKKIIRRILGLTIYSQKKQGGEFCLVFCCIGILL